MAGKTILLFSDVHLPFHHEDFIDFLEAVTFKYNPKEIICGGDLTDSYCFSRYPKDPEQISATEEFTKVQEGVAKLATVFKKLTIVDSNHDARLWNRATTNGIPRYLVKPYLEVIGAPKGWGLLDDYTVKDSTERDWYIAHQPNGTTSQYAKAMCSNVAVGHLHSNFGATFICTPGGTFWAVDIGCLIGFDRIAFGYSKMSVRKPARGCVLIKDGVPKLIPMHVDLVTGKWERRL